MADFSKWGIGPDDVSGESPTQSVSEPDFNSKWLGVTQAQQPVSTTAPQKSFIDKALNETFWGRFAQTIAQGLTAPGDALKSTPENPVTTEQMIQPAASLAGIIGTGGVPTVAGAAKPLIEPATAELANLARTKFGIMVRGAQISESPLINYLDAVLQTKPFSGYTKNVAEQASAFNRSVAKTIGEDADKVTPEVMANAKARLGQNYEDIAANTTLKYDQPLHQTFNSIFDESNSVLAPGEHQIIQKQLKNVLSKVDESGTIDGKTFQSILRTGSPLDRATKSADTNVKYYAGQIKSALIDAMGRHAPVDMQALLKQTNSQYKAMKTIEPLVEKSPTGDVSPALLMGAVRKSYPGMAYGRGNSDLSDLARIGQGFLKDMPQSGTQPRLSAAQLLGLGGGAIAEGGLAYLDPVLAAKVAALGLTAAVTKAGINRAAGSVLRSNWYANRLINSALPEQAAKQPNMLRRLTNSDIPYLPPAIPQVTIPVRPGYYQPAQ